MTLSLLRLGFTARIQEIDAAIAQELTPHPVAGIPLPDENRLAMLEGRKGAFLDAIKDIDDL